MTIKSFFLLFISAVGIQSSTSCMEDSLEQARRELAENPYALHDAARLGKLEQVRKLLAIGANVNTRRDNLLGGTTPLHEAVANEQKDIVKLLIQHGANINAQDDDDNTPLHNALAYTLDGFGIPRNKDKNIVEFLIHNKADVNVANSFGHTPLHKAVMCEYEENIIELLITHNASITARDGDGETPVHRARKLSVVKTLLFSRPAGIPSLKTLCLNSIYPNIFLQTHIAKLPVELRELVAAKTEQLGFIQHVLTIANHAGQTPRDTVTRYRITRYYEVKDTVAFIDNVLKAKTLDDLKALGYQG